MLLLAAGRGSRFGGPLPKAYLLLAGRPLLVHSVQRLVASVTTTDRVQVIVVVHPTDREAHLAAWLPELRRLVADRGTLHVVDGGASRQESMLRGFAAADGDVDVVLVHDAARALVPSHAVRECLDAALRTGAALLAIPATDTQKKVVEGLVASTLDRSGIWLAQTPQVIRPDLLRRAAANAAAMGIEGTDDVSLVERMGQPVAVVPGSVTNLKITHPGDLALAEAILAAGLA